MTVTFVRGNIIDFQNHLVVHTNDEVAVAHLIHKIKCDRRYHNVVVVDAIKGIIAIPRFKVVFIFDRKETMINVLNAVGVVLEGENKHINIKGIDVITPRN